MDDDLLRKRQARGRQRAQLTAARDRAAALRSWTQVLRERTDISRMQLRWSLASRQCRWVVATDEDEKYCGRRPDPRSRNQHYCTEHYELSKTLLFGEEELG